MEYDLYSVVVIKDKKQANKFFITSKIPQDCKATFVRAIHLLAAQIAGEAYIIFFTDADKPNIKEVLEEMAQSAELSFTEYDVSIFCIKADIIYKPLRRQK